MKLGEAIRTHLYGKGASYQSAAAKRDTEEVLKILDRWLRHNGHHKAADALDEEHMP